MGLVPSVLKPEASSLSLSSATFSFDKAAGVGVDVADMVVVVQWTYLFLLLDVF